jgi:hypothetical protein
MARMKDDPAFLVDDQGNTNGKSAIMGQFGYEDVIPYAIQIPSESVYKTRTTRAKFRAEAQDDSAVFEMRLRSSKEYVPFIIGEEAQRGGQVKRITGAGKYVEGNWDAAFCAKAIRHFPGGHNNIVLAIAHPPDAIPYLDQMMDLLGGAHRIRTLTGEEWSYTVRHIVPWDEPGGAMVRFIQRNGEAGNPVNLADGDYILVLDFGGKISSMTPVRIGKNKSIKALFDQAVVFNLGIQNVLQALEEELKGLHPELFQEFKEIPKNILESALATRKVKISNKTYDVTQAVLNAIAPIIDRTQSIYVDRHEGGKNFVGIVIGGGGGERLFPYLANKKDGILKHDFVYMAEEPGKLHLANLRGGMEALKVWVTANQRLVYA